MLNRPSRFPAFTLVFLLLPLALPAASWCRGETVYIKPSLEVLMRRGKGENYRIVASLPMGTPVVLLQADKEWAHIRLQDGSEGWVRSRFLGSSPLIPIAAIKGGLDAEEITADAQGRPLNLSEENSRLRKELAACTTDRSTLADKYQTLISDPESVIHTKTSLSEAQRQIEEMRQKLAEAQIENTVLRKNHSIKWFFTGGLVLLAGWLIGRLTTNGRKKRSSLIS